MYARIPVGLLKKLLTEDNQQDKQYAVCFILCAATEKQLRGLCLPCITQKKLKAKVIWQTPCIVK